MEKEYETEMQKKINGVYIDITTGEYPNDLERVYIKYKAPSGYRIRKGFFYLNGGKPVFAAYGSEIKNVIAWAHRA